MMIQKQSNDRRFTVLTALAVVVALAGLFTVRVMARGADSPSVALSARPIAPPATVPEPISIAISDIPTPFCWTCSENSDASLSFQIDLDVLAPLGDGAGNAAEWFKDFALRTGSRYEQEGRLVYSKRFIEHTIEGRRWTVLPGDDPLLLEAEPWIDQATCSFYPEFYDAEGRSTQIPSLLTFTDMARSWVWRGMHSDDAESARQDFRRAIRLGRLVRQDDITIIQDLVGVVCIRLGAEALYELAREEGDATMMLVASRVLADKDAIKQGTMRRISRVDGSLSAFWGQDGQPGLSLSDLDLAHLIQSVRDLPDRRFRLQGLIALHTVLHLGTAAQQSRAAESLTVLAADPDPVIADLAARLERAPYDPETITLP